MNLKALGLAISAAFCLAGQAMAADPAAKKYDKETMTSKELVSYAIGVDVARNFKKNDVDFDVDAMFKGVLDVMAGDRLLLTEKEYRKVLNSFQGEVRRKMQQTRLAAAAENQRAGTAFLAENKTKEGVVTLPSGVQYKVLKAGEGKKPLESSVIVCNYRGTTLAGVEFDATEPGKPANLKLAALIAGWREAMRLMPEGSKWQIVIPAQHAYGNRGVGNDIGPNETLIFEVELLEVR